MVLLSVRVLAEAGSAAISYSRHACGRYGPRYGSRYGPRYEPRLGQQCRLTHGRGLAQQCLYHGISRGPLSDVRRSLSSSIKDNDSIKTDSNRSFDIDISALGPESAARYTS
jgi:hypothetical protein